jgi:hypothetical protein
VCRSPNPETEVAVVDCDELDVLRETTRLLFILLGRLAVVVLPLGVAVPVLEFEALSSESAEADF